MTVILSNIKIQSETLKNAYKPYDIVSNEKGDVGFIQEVSVNKYQPSPGGQISYAVNWIVGNDKHAWFSHDDLTKHCNLFVKIAESSCHPFGNNKEWVAKLMNKNM